MRQDSYQHIWTSFTEANVFAQSSDIAPSLFLMAYGSKEQYPRDMPKEFRIITARAQSEGDDGEGAPTVYAAVVSLTPGSTKLPQLFVQGPPTRTTEGALRALLGKMESMVARRWKLLERKNYLER
jgi:hypothetical protein